MSRKIFHTLVDPDEAVRLVVEKIHPHPLGTEKVELTNALHRVLAEDLYSPIDHPPFDRSEVDGYAVRSVDVEWSDELSPVHLRVKGRVKPGEKPVIEAGVNDAVEVATGAMIPRGYDSVVMEEYVERDGEVLKVFRASPPGDNISTAGSDISSGDLVLFKGTLLKHGHLALLAGLGIREVEVFKKPKAIVFSTGEEVVEPGNTLEVGKVYDVNGVLITSYLRELGVEAYYGGLLPDDYDVIKDRISRALEDYDMVFTSGGTSAGVSDLVYKVFSNIGEILVHGLKTKPGKPTVIATSKGKILIGLPGFPLSCYMILIRVVSKIVKLYTGALYDVKTVDASMPVQIRKQVGKTWLIPVMLVESENDLAAYPVSMSSGAISPLILSDGFVEIGENVDIVMEGERVRVYLFRDLPEKNRLNVIGSNDPLLTEILRFKDMVNVSRVLNVGSTGGWKAVARGEADVAPTHLLDEETGCYNTPFLKKYGLEDKAVLIRGYDRLIGIVVAKGNPKNILSLEDFLRSDVRMVNRSKGSGVRVYLDMALKKIAIAKGLDLGKLSRIINGYTYEVKTHTAVATAIKQGRADAGLAVGYVAELLNLDFIPLTWEEYDFLIPKKKIEKEAVSKLIDALKHLNQILDKAEPLFKKYYRAGEGSGFEKVSCFQKT
uniref:Molybdopterin biosynthesis protein n=1 Tax=Thermosphaera aggregans TaxID=54254 RepID=A0A7C2FPB4_9CREN